MAFTALSFVVAFLSCYALCNLSDDVTNWTWYCNKTENHAYFWIDWTKFVSFVSQPNKTLFWLRYCFHDNKLLFRPLIEICRNFCFVLNYPVALKIITEITLTC